MILLRSESRLGWNPSIQTRISKPLSGGASEQPENVPRPSKGFHCFGAAPNGGFSLRRTPSVIKRAYLSRRGAKAVRFIDKPAQPNLGMGIGTNGLSTYEASSPRYGYPEAEQPWKAAPVGRVQVMACLCLKEC